MAAGDSLTISEFLEKRFDDRTGVLRSLVAVVTLFFVIIYISSGLVGGSKLLEETFGLAPNVGIAVTLLAVASYTLVGGFLAVSPHRRVPVPDNARLFHDHPSHAVAGNRQPYQRTSFRGQRVPEPAQRLEGWSAVLGVRGIAAGMGVRRLGFAASAAALHGHTRREYNPYEPQHCCSLALLDNRLWCRHRVGGPAGAGTGWNATVGARRPREGLLCGDGGVLPSSLCGRAAVRGDRCSDEHGRLPAAVGFGRRDRPTCRSCGGSPMACRRRPASGWGDCCSW